MIRVGVIGLGMMGLTHLQVYAKRTDAKVVAIAERNPGRLSGQSRAAGNIAGLAGGGFDPASVKTYADGMELIRDPEVDLVDICLPTPAHFEHVKAALKRGKHVLVEKPLARTSKDAFRLARLAEKSKRIAMCAMCMRFWPGWTWLKDAIANKTFGNVKAATFRRLSSHPGGPIYSSGELSGGAALDLHIHDTDFIQYCFGPPKAVISRGYSHVTDAIDHIVTQYVYDDVPLVLAEGSWAMAPGFGFSMQYTVNFERGTAIFDLSQNPPLRLVRDGKSEPVSDLPPGMGYEYEIGYLLDCIQQHRRPQIVTLHDAARTIRIVEAEVKSVQTARAVSLR